MARQLQYNLTGQTIGKLLVIERAGSSSGAVCWRCQCECGNITLRTTPGLIRPKLTPSCGCVGNPKNRKHKTSSDATIAALRRRYKYDAEARHLEYALTDEQFLDIITRDCFYCGQPPSKKHNVYKKYGRYGTKWIDEADVCLNGIDRQDNQVGYTVSNCTPCCKTCNYAKRNTSQSDFLQWINRVWQHQTNKKVS